MHAFVCLGAENLVQKRKLREQRLELGTRELPLDAAHQAGQMQPARMLCRGLEQTLEAGAQIGRAADVGLGARLGAIQGEHRLRLRQLRQRGFRIGRIEFESRRQRVETPRFVDRRCTCSE